MREAPWLFEMCELVRVQDRIGKITRLGEGVRAGSYHVAFEDGGFGWYWPPEMIRTEKLS